MKINRKITTIALGLTIFTAGVGSAQIANKVLKVGGAIVIADQFGSQINKALNVVTGQNKLAEAGTVSKVVPVLSVGSRGAVGVVQVSGPKEAVDRTKAVAQIQTQVRAISKLQARVLIPIDSRNLSSIKRVKGVGVSAVIDIKL